MLKKIMITTMGVLFAGSVTLFSYRALEPKAAYNSVESYVPAAAPVSALRAAITDGQVSENTQDMTPVGQHYYYFCKVENPDCVYINDYVLKPLAESINVSSFDVLEYYELNTLPCDYPVTKLKSQWGFESSPAFVSLNYNADGTTTIHSVLQWNKEDPIDQETMKQWMIDNQIWSGPVEEQGELIEKPVE